MKRLMLATLALLTATALQAQGLTLGGRYASYDTDLDAGIASLETGRASSVGFLGAYRNNGLVFDAAIDHDFESGVTVGDFLPIDFADYSRDRIEAGVGYGVLPVLDVMAGVRKDDITVGGNFFGFDFFDDLNFDHQALWGGVTAHSRTIRPFGWYVSGRGYAGTAKFDVEGARVKSDTSGAKLEAGFPIPLGLSGWEVTPGFEYEQLKTDDFDVELKTNRFFIAFTYTLGQ
jgi:hypothetical protein